LGEEIVEIEAIDARPKQKTGEVLQLCKNSRCMLTRNLNIKSGLCNGSLVWVTQISKNFDDDGLPDIVWVRPDNYIGVPFPLRTDIPITPVNVPCYDKFSGRTIMKRQLPLSLGWGMTSHKSQVCIALKNHKEHISICIFILQGKTCKYLVVGNPVPGDNCTMFTSESPHLFYVSISRATTLEGVMLQRPFSPSLVTGGRRLALQNWQRELRRLEALEEETRRNPSIF